MAVRELLRDFARRATVIDKTMGAHGMVAFNTSGDDYGPGAGGQYVDTAEWRFSQGGRLWTDKASWCMIMASYAPRANRCFLAHLPPGELPVGPGLCLKAYSAVPPANLALFTMPVHFEIALSSEQGAKNSAFWSVYQSLDLAYPLQGGAAKMAPRTTIVLGYAGVEWDTSFAVAVESYGVFPMTGQPDNLGWVKLFHPGNVLV